MGAHQSMVSAENISVAATHSTALVIRRELETAHDGLFSQALSFFPYTCQNPPAKKAIVIAAKYSLYGSKALRLPIQAPLTPMVTSINGATQHDDAISAPNMAAAAANRPSLVELVADCSFKFCLA